jgi:biotin-(acetyl-CoA carboxylase) ligase
LASIPQRLIVVGCGISIFAHEDTVERDTASLDSHQRSAHDARSVFRATADEVDDPRTVEDTGKLFAAFHPTAAARSVHNVERMACRTHRKRPTVNFA